MAIDNTRFAGKTCRLYVGFGKPLNVTKDELADHFKRYGKVLECLIRGTFGFVQFDSPQSVVDAVNNENGKDMLGIQLRCDYAEERRNPPRSDSDPSRGRDNSQNRYSNPRRDSREGMGRRRGDRDVSYRDRSLSPKRGAGDDRYRSRVPIQILLLGESQRNYCNYIKKTLHDNGIDSNVSTLNKRKVSDAIRDLDRPGSYAAVVLGRRNEENRTVSYRKYPVSGLATKNMIEISVNELLERLESLRRDNISPMDNTQPGLMKQPPLDRYRDIARSREGGYRDDVGRNTRGNNSAYRNDIPADRNRGNQHSAYRSDLGRSRDGITYRDDMNRNRDGNVYRNTVPSYERGDNSRIPSRINHHDNNNNDINNPSSISPYDNGNAYRNLLPPRSNRDRNADFLGPPGSIYDPRDGASSSILPGERDTFHSNNAPSQSLYTRGDNYQTSSSAPLQQHNNLNHPPHARNGSSYNNNRHSTSDYRGDTDNNMLYDPTRSSSTIVSNSSALSLSSSALPFDPVIQRPNNNNNDIHNVSTANTNDGSRRRNDNIQYNVPHNPRPNFDYGSSRQHIGSSSNNNLSAPSDPRARRPTTDPRDIYYNNDSFNHDSGPSLSTSAAPYDPSNAFPPALNSTDIAKMLEMVTGSSGPTEPLSSIPSDRRRSRSRSRDRFY